MARLPAGFLAGRKVARSPASPRLKRYTAAPAAASRQRTSVATTAPSSGVEQRSARQAHNLKAAGSNPATASIPDGPAGYAAYMRSDLWRELRRLAIERDDGRCRVCDGGHGLEVHHRRYPRVWARDKLTNLTTLCAVCHAAIERLLKRRRR